MTKAARNSAPAIGGVKKPPRLRPGIVALQVLEDASSHSSAWSVKSLRISRTIWGSKAQPSPLFWRRISSDSFTNPCAIQAKRLTATTTMRGNGYQWLVSNRGVTFKWVWWLQKGFWRKRQKILVDNKWVLGKGQRTLVTNIMTIGKDKWYWWLING